MTERAIHKPNDAGGRGAGESKRATLRCPAGASHPPDGRAEAAAHGPAALPSRPTGTASIVLFLVYGAFLRRGATSPALLCLQLTMEAEGEQRPPPLPREPQLERETPRAAARVSERCGADRLQGLTYVLAPAHRPGSPPLTPAVAWELVGGVKRFECVATAKQAVGGTGIRAAGRASDRHRRDSWNEWRRSGGGAAEVTATAAQRMLRTIDETLCQC